MVTRRFPLVVIIIEMLWGWYEVAEGLRRSRLNGGASCADLYGDTCQ